MNRSQRVVSAILLAGMAAIYPQASKAEGFTGAEFLTWSEKSQNVFIENALGMVAVIMTQTSKPQVGTCIDNWYFVNETLSAQRNAEIRAKIAEFPQYHPRGVIAGFVKKYCGSLP